MFILLAYSLEYFADALKSCLKDSDGFIHINGNEYYHIRPRQPFALQKDYWQPIPSPLKLDKSGQDISDIVISLSILVVTIIGLSAALWKLKMFDWVFVKSHKVWKKRITANAPTEGGYCRFVCTVLHTLKKLLTLFVRHHFTRIRGWNFLYLEELFIHSFNYLCVRQLSRKIITVLTILTSFFLLLSLFPSLTFPHSIFVYLPLFLSLVLFLFIFLSLSLTLSSLLYFSYFFSPLIQHNIALPRSSLCTAYGELE